MAPETAHAMIDKFLEDVGTYRIGQRVMVLRSSGDFSPAFVVGYTPWGGSGMYKVELFERGSGVYKDGILEEEIGSSWDAVSQRATAQQQRGDSDSSDTSGSPWTTSSSEEEEQEEGVAFTISCAQRKKKGHRRTS